jgi:hypothetical protein
MQKLTRLLCLTELFLTLETNKNLYKLLDLAGVQKLELSNHLDQASIPIGSHISCSVKGCQ